MNVECLYFLAEMDFSFVTSTLTENKFVVNSNWTQKSNSTVSK
jgi:hypothetical protein